MSHNHSHSHTHEIAHYTRAFMIGIVLNLLYVMVEAGYGFYTGSLALMADAGHNLSDVLSLALAWVASIIARKAASDNHTYGYRKATVLASLASALLLLIALAGITWEAVGRLFKPEHVAGSTVIIVAGIGFLVNAVTALFFARSQSHDLNIRGAFLHMAADAVISLGVVVAGVIMLFVDWPWIDPAVSLAIVAVIFTGTWGLLWDSLNYVMDAVPKHISLIEIRRYLVENNNVKSIHDLHVWPLSTTEYALTVHLVTYSDIKHGGLLGKIQEDLYHHFGISHATIQIETSNEDIHCTLNKPYCV